MVVVGIAQAVVVVRIEVAEVGWYHKAEAVQTGKQD